MVDVLFVLGHLYCIVVAFLISAEVTTWYTKDATDAWARRTLLLGVLLSAVLCWFYNEVAFAYFIEETTTTTTTQTVLQFKD